MLIKLPCLPFRFYVEPSVYVCLGIGPRIEGIHVDLVVFKLNPNKYGTEVSKPTGCMAWFD